MNTSYTKQNLYEDNYEYDDWGYFVDIEKCNNENQNNNSFLEPTFIEPTFIERSMNDYNYNYNTQILYHRSICLRPFFKKLIRASSITAFIIIMSTVIICTL